MKRKQYPQPASDSEMVKEPMPVTQMTTVFNPSQMALLRMFARDQSEETALEIKQVLSKHFQTKADAALNELWDSGQLDQEKLDELCNMHIRDILH